MLAEKRPFPIRPPSIKFSYNFTMNENGAWFARPQRADKLSALPVTQEFSYNFTMNENGAWFARPQRADKLSALPDT